MVCVVFWRAGSTQHSLLMLVIFLSDLSPSQSSDSIKSLGNALHQLLAEGLVPVNALPLLHDDLLVVLGSVCCLCCVL